MDNYLIPANSKKSKLILGFFTYVDLGIFLGGVAITLGLLLTTHADSFGVLFSLLIPLLIATFLVLPVPHYHNILQLITNVVTFIMNPKRYYWKGWCINDEKQRIGK